MKPERKLTSTLITRASLFFFDLTIGKRVNTGRNFRFLGPNFLFLGQKTLNSVKIGPNFWFSLGQTTSKFAKIG